MRIAVIILVFSLCFGSGKKEQVDKLNMTLTFENDLLSVHAEYSHFNIKKATDSIFFVFNPGYGINDISAKGLESFEWIQREGRPFPYLLLKFESPIQMGEDLVVSFDYLIDLSKMNHINQGWIELNTDKLWFPNFNDIDNRFLSEVTLRNLDEGYTPVSYTHSTLETLADNSYQISSTKPTPEAFVLIGKDMKMRTFTNHDIPITFFASDTTSNAILESMHTKVLKSIELLNEVYGESDSISEFMVVLRNVSKRKFPINILVMA